jgi:DNA-binding FrmR family transcriptional regulator
MNIPDIGIALPLIAILIGVTGLLIKRAYTGNPINKAEEQIFTLGIALGGIAMFLGLLNVGVGNFRESLAIVVHHLVGAVAINVVAMFCKMVYSHIASSKEVVRKSNEVISLDDLANVLKANQKNQDENTSRLISALESSQTKMDVNFLKLDTTLNSFVRDLADRLVKQIEQVIVTLNEKLTVQLGDNFKRLNDAVNNMVIWQNNYKEQLEHWQSANQLAVASLTKSAESFALTAERSQKFSDSAQRLEHLIQSLTNQYELLVRAQVQMENSLKSLDQMPRIVGEKINEMVNVLGNSALQITSAGMQLTNVVGDNATKVSAMSSVLHSEIASTQVKMGDMLNSSVQAFGINVDRHVQQLFEKLSNSSRDIDGHLKNSINNFELALKKDAENFNKSLENSQHEYAQQLITSAQKIEEHTYQIEKAIEEELDRIIRIFAEKVVNIMTYAVQTAQSAYSTANDAKLELTNGRT